jgi:hypothetical protein
LTSPELDAGTATGTTTTAEELPRVARAGGPLEVFEPDGCKGGAGAVWVCGEEDDDVCVDGDRDGTVAPVA